MHWLMSLKMLEWPGLLAFPPLGNVREYFRPGSLIIDPGFVAWAPHNYYVLGQQQRVSNTVANCEHWPPHQ